jgi:hypothetical protein
MPIDYEFMYHSDQLEQTAVCRELAPEGLLHALGQPWKALENALRNRNFENRQLINRVAELERLILSDTEAKVLVALLELASDQFSNHGCNDFELAKCIPDLEERRKLMKSYNDYNGSPEDFEYDDEHGSKFEIESDAGLMGYLMDRVKEQLEREG